MDAIRSTHTGKTVLPLATILLAESKTDRRKRTMATSLLHECRIYYPEQLETVSKDRKLGLKVAQTEQDRVWHNIHARRQREARARRAAEGDAPGEDFSGSIPHTAPIGGAPEWFSI
eukprot:PhM_4_TR11636/c5_g1_i2/m.6172